MASRAAERLPDDCYFNWADKKWSAEGRRRDGKGRGCHWSKILSICLFATISHAFFAATTVLFLPSLLLLLIPPRLFSSYFLFLRSISSGMSLLKSMIHYIHSCTKRTRFLVYFLLLINFCSNTCSNSRVLFRRWLALFSESLEMLNQSISTPVQHPNHNNNGSDLGMNSNYVQVRYVRHSVCEKKTSRPYGNKPIKRKK